MSNTNTNLQTQTSSVLQNDTVSSCSISNIQEKTQLSRSRCMHSLKEIKSLFKFLLETLQDYGRVSIFKRTSSQDLDLLEQHLTKDILSRTDCTTTLTNLRTKFENAFNSEFEERMRKYTRYNAQSFNDAMIFCQTKSCSEKEDSNSETASNKSAKECSLNSEPQDVHAIKYKMSKAKERCMAYFRSLHSHLQVLLKDDLKGTRIEHGFKRAFIQMTDTYFVEYTGIEVQHFRDTLLQHMGNVKKSVAERTRHKRQSGNDTDADDTDIRPIYDEEPMAEVQLTAGCNIFAIRQQHTEQPEIINEGRVDQWIPTGKLFDSCTRKDDSEPTHGSNIDIPNIHECKQTMDSMAAEKADISETIVKVDSHMMIQKNDVCLQEFRPQTSMSNGVISRQF
ncbi:hypothetical protein Tco_0653290 [Tanacetum coccineum]|uniref:Uncharacterized protein n=1 Tax=Tanacetum coccineum TaxID=301880 RepID=A0ABQ4WZY5_9ASTR